MDVKNRKVWAWMLLLTCAVIAAFSAALVFEFSGQPILECYIASFIMVLSGLVGAVEPLLLVLK